VITNVSIFMAFGAGLLSFLSPCVLPLIPGYLSFISGRSGQEIRSGEAKLGIFFRTLFFVAGFTTIFIGLGLVFSGGGMLFAGRATRIITSIAGVIIVLFGLNMIFDLVKALNREVRAHVSTKPAGAAGSFVVGMAFGAGWTPCIGPILASILLVASRSGRAPEAAILLGSYSAGLALPFLLTGLFFEHLSPVMNWFKKRGKEVRIASGLLLVVLGLAMAFGRLTTLNGMFVRWGMQLKSFMGRNPDAAVVAAAAVWSALALLSSIPAIVKARKGQPFRAYRLLLPAGFSVMLGLELGRVISLLEILSNWFLYQGL
jgi:cytochrome c-type biogenesis protein